MVLILLYKTHNFNVFLTQSTNSKYLPLKRPSKVVMQTGPSDIREYV